MHLCRFCLTWDDVVEVPVRRWVITATDIQRNISAVGHPTNNLAFIIMKSPLLSEFFNELSIILVVQCTELDSSGADQTAVQVSVDSMEWFNRKDRDYWVGDTCYQFSDDEVEHDPADLADLDFRKLYPEELSSVAYHSRKITFMSNKCPAKTFHATNGRNFTVAELIEVIRQWEELDRCRIDPGWKEVDRSHVYFEGLELKGHGVFSVRWGS
jgi:hypothetical protein